MMTDELASLNRGKFEDIDDPHLHHRRLFIVDVSVLYCSGKNNALMAILLNISAAKMSPCEHILIAKSKWINH